MLPYSFNAQRRVKDCDADFYSQAHGKCQRLMADGAGRARGLAAWFSRIDRDWANVRVESVYGIANGETQAAGTLTPLKVAAAAVLIAAASNNLVKGIYAYSLADRKAGWQSLSLQATLAAAGLVPLFWIGSLYPWKLVKPSWIRGHAGTDATSRRSGSLRYFRRSLRSTGTDCLIPPGLLSKLPLGSHEEFLVLSLAQRAGPLTVDLPPDKAPGTAIRQDSSTLFGIIKVVVLGPPVFFQ